jgi:cysteine desulfurase
MLDMEGIAVSTGSACASGSLEPSHVLRAMGIPPEDCHASIRFTLGKFTTATEIDRVIEAVPPIVKRLRDMSPLKRK